MSDDDVLKQILGAVDDLASAVRSGTQVELLESVVRELKDINRTLDEIKSEIVNKA